MIGKTLNHYRILSPLGKGGMGEVYLAEDTRLKRRVALKILPAESSDPERLQRFRREAETVAALSHPNIVTIHSVEEDQGVHFITMEQVTGTPLDQLMEGEQLPLRRVFELAVPLAEALSAAHDKGITHRDLKPANVMVTEDGHVKVLDFGLAKFMETSPEALENLELSTKPQLTSDGLVMGTVPYMSPEQAQGKPVDGRSDIFSLGIILYEMTTGRRPFTGKTSAAIISSILKDTPPPPAEFNAGLPNHLGRIIRRCLEKEPARRFQTARDLRNDLRDLHREWEAEQSSLGSSTAARAPREHTSSRGRWIATGILIGLATVAVGGWWLTHQGGPSLDSTGSIAVLPFVNASGNSDTEYLGDGVTESLISRLSAIPDLTIMARNTVFRFKGSDRDPQEIGRELGVGAVLAGRVDLRGETLVIGTELIQVSDGTQIWGDRFTRPMNDLLAVEQEISRTLAEKLEVELTGTQSGIAAAVDPEAYRLYLKGMYHWNRRTEADLEKGNEYFLEAIRVDPDFALAHSALANGYLVMANWGFVDPSEARELGKRYALRALELDPTIAEAHAALAGIHTEHEWDWARGEAAFRRAIELKPAYATGHQWYAEFLRAMDRPGEAMTEIRKAREFDPLSLIVEVMEANTLIDLGRPDEAIHRTREILEREPDFMPAQSSLVGLCLSTGRTDGLAEEALKLFRMDGTPVEVLGRMREAADEGGIRGLFEVRLEYLEASAETVYVSNFELARVNAVLGNLDEAFAHFERAYENREPSMMYLQVKGQIPDLTSDPRWRDLVERMNFPPAPGAGGS